MLLTSCITFIIIVVVRAGFRVRVGWGIIQIVIWIFRFISQSSHGLVEGEKYGVPITDWLFRMLPFILYLDLVQKFVDFFEVS